MGTARILIVEDDVIVSRDLSQSLVKMGYAVCDVASSGVEALVLAETHRPDLVIMDVMFSEGDIDGIETAQRLRDRLDTPVIYLTALADQATFERAKHTLPLAYVVKPFDAKELALTIATSLEKHRMALELAATMRQAEAVMAAVTDAVIITDDGGRVTHLNRVAEQLIGRTTTEVLGSDSGEILKPIDDGGARSRLAPWSVPSPQTATVQRAELYDRSGKKKIVTYACTSIVDKRGNIYGVVFAVRP